MVPLLSSAARMPLPGATSALAVAANSSVVIAGTSSHVMGGISMMEGMVSPFSEQEPVDVAPLGLLDQPVAGSPGPDREVPDRVTVGGQHLDQLTGSKPGHGHARSGYRQGIVQPSQVRGHAQGRTHRLLLHWSSGSSVAAGPAAAQGPIDPRPRDLRPCP